MRVFQVELYIIGPITIERPLIFDTDKELSLGDIFNSKIKLTTIPQGLEISATVSTTDSDSACRVALLFIGKMLDILCIKINMALYVTNSDIKLRGEKQTIKTVVSREEFDRCFELSRSLNLQKTTLARSLTWYRKGLYTEDPFDKFLALWNSINVIAGKYCSDNEFTKKGIVNQIWDCFIILWGKEYVDKEFKPDGNHDRIKELNNIRNDIAHGLVPVEINYAGNVIKKLGYVNRLAYRFITEFSKLHIEQDLV